MGITINDYKFQCDYKGCVITWISNTLTDIYYWQIIKNNSEDFRQWDVYCKHHALPQEKQRADAKIDEIP